MNIDYPFHFAPDGRTLLAARFGLPLPQTQHLGNLEAQRQLVQGVLLDEVGTHAGQIAFRQCRQLTIEQARDRQIQNGITQKLQPLIVVGRKTAVRGGALEK